MWASTQAIRVLTCLFFLLTDRRSKRSKGSGVQSGAGGQVAAKTATQDKALKKTVAVDKKKAAAAEKKAKEAAKKKAAASAKVSLFI